MVSTHTTPIYPIIPNPNQPILDSSALQEQVQTDVLPPQPVVNDVVEAPSQPTTQENQPQISYIGRAISSVLSATKRIYEVATNINVVYFAVLCAANYVSVLTFGTDNMGLLLSLAGSGAIFGAAFGNRTAVQLPNKTVQSIVRISVIALGTILFPAQTLGAVIIAAPVIAGFELMSLINRQFA